MWERILEQGKRILSLATQVDQNTKDIEASLEALNELTNRVIHLEANSGNLDRRLNDARDREAAERRAMKAEIEAMLAREEYNRQEAVRYLRDLLDRISKQLPPPQDES